MINTRMMYLRPGNLFKDFLIEDGSQKVNAFGRPKEGYDRENIRMLCGCLAAASLSDRERWKQLDHSITHTIVQAGKPLAGEEDKLILGEKVYIIHGVNDCDGLGITTIYYVEERSDVK